MMKVKKLLTFSVVLALSAISVKANNLKIWNVSVAGNDITFDISWENSWNTTLAPNNWDAAWVFIKYKNCDSTNWTHADVEDVITNHTASTPLMVEAVSDGKGVFLKRSAAGTGNIDSASITLRMLPLGAGPFNFKVNGIEMVYVPQNDFEVGDGAASNRFNSVTITSTEQASGVTAAILGGPGTVDLPSTYPMGYNGFYTMKYEISQEQYSEFLNSLTYEQQESRVQFSPDAAPGNFAMVANGYYRMKIKIAASGTPGVYPATFATDYNNNSIYHETNDGQNIACGFLSWLDLSAYLDWAALRPMTELEFEKIGRGVSGRIGAEYPWGTTALTMANSYSLGGTPSEKATGAGNGLSAYGRGTSTSYGPYRTGFAATGSTNRSTSGASYYAVMEMGGNLYEQVISSNSGGADFTGVLGDGELTSTGDADVTGWPVSVTAFGTTQVYGSTYRGGCYADSQTYMQVSNRTFYNSAAPLGRDRRFGGRGVR